MTSPFRVLLQRQMELMSHPFYFGSAIFCLVFGALLAVFGESSHALLTPWAGFGAMAFTGLGIGLASIVTRLDLESPQPNENTWLLSRPVGRLQVFTARFWPSLSVALGCLLAVGFLALVVQQDPLLHTKIQIEASELHEPIAQAGYELQFGTIIQEKYINTAELAVAGRPVVGVIVAASPVFHNMLGAALLTIMLLLVLNLPTMRIAPAKGVSGSISKLTILVLPVALVWLLIVMGDEFMTLATGSWYLHPLLTYLFMFFVLVIFFVAVRTMWLRADMG